MVTSYLKNTSNVPKNDRLKGFNHKGSAFTFGTPSSRKLQTPTISNSPYFR